MEQDIQLPLPLPLPLLLHLAAYIVLSSSAAIQQQLSLFGQFHSVLGPWCPYPTLKVVRRMRGKRTTDERVDWQY